MSTHATVATPTITPSAPSRPVAQRRASRPGDPEAAPAGGRDWTVDSGSPRLRVRRWRMARSAGAAAGVDVGGRWLSIRHLDRLLYPRAGTTKAELLDPYVRIAPVMLPHPADRLLHMHRHPEDVGRQGPAGLRAAGRGRGDVRRHDAVRAHGRRAARGRGGPCRGRCGRAALRDRDVLERVAEQGDRLSPVLEARQ